MGADIGVRDSEGRQARGFPREFKPGPTKHALDKSPILIVYPVMIIFIHRHFHPFSHALPSIEKSQVTPNENR